MDRIGVISGPVVCACGRARTKVALVSLLHLLLASHRSPCSCLCLFVLFLLFFFPLSCVSAFCPFACLGYLQWVGSLDVLCVRACAYMSVSYCTVETKQTLEPFILHSVNV